MAAGERVLVGDIGGTNARFAVAELTGAAPRLRAAKSYPVAGHPGMQAALEQYFADTGESRPDSAVIAVAGPVTDGATALTNGAWSFSETALRAMGFSATKLINDYTALALGVGHLESGDLKPLGPVETGRPDATLAILGAGTGLGVAALVRSQGQQAVAVTEGGHIGFAPGDEVEIEVLRILTRQHGRVSLERILSGAGMGDLYRALGQIEGMESEPKGAPEIVAAALAEADPLCVRTLERFCAIYGSAAGDLALAYGARGGVYLGGGIAPRILTFLQAGGFRARFEAKGRFAGYLAAIPTRVITHPYAALLGAAEASSS